MAHGPGAARDAACHRRAHASAGRAGRRTGAARPAEPHWYLFHLAADTDTQGGGIGSALLAAGLARVDTEQALAHLECTAELVGYYARRRFAGTGTVELDGGAVSLVTMSRSPNRATGG